MFSAVFVVFGFYLLKKTVIDPIRKLEDAAKKIAGGTLVESVEIKNNNEIGSLSNSLNKMTKTLVQKIEELENANREIAEAQNQIIRSERMASLGRLASGIAHEIGNPLGAISGYVDLLLDGIDDEDEERDILERIIKGLKRIKGILKRILDFSRPSALEVKTIDINDVVSRTFEFVKISLKDIEVNLDLKEDIKLVRADPRQLEQVFVNLILNARDSMESGGSVVIATMEEEKEYKPRFFSERRSTDPPGHDFTRKRKLPPVLKHNNKWVKVVISDNGCGMDDDILRQIFTPFFTTKDPGKGTGLGLPISLGIVQTFGGDIRVSSKEGRGSVFEVVLPAVDE